MSRLSKFFIVKAQANPAAPAIINILGVIGETLDSWSWTLKNTEDEVREALALIPLGTKIDVHVNSEGGDMQCALGIRNALTPRAADLTFYNDGYMCSSAAILPPKESPVICPMASFVMIHNPYACFEGDSDAAEKAVAALKAHNDVYAGIIDERIGQTKEAVLALMKAETWWTGEQAVEIGYGIAPENETAPAAEEVDEELVVMAKASKIFGRFKNVPTHLRRRITAAATASNPKPPTNQPQPKEKSMKLLINALVAAGFTVSADATEDQLLPHVSALLSERAGLKAENQKHIEARKNRVTALVEAAFTDQIIAEGRKAGLIALGETNEAEVIAQLSELRAAKAQKPARGARPAAQGEGEGETPEEKLADIRAQMSDERDPAKRKVLANQCRELRGHKGLFTAPAARN